MAAVNKVIWILGGNPTQKWSCTVPFRVHPAIANATFFQATANYRYSTYRPGTLAGIPAVLGGEYQGVLQLDCIVMAIDLPEGVCHKYRLEFTNHNYYAEESCEGYEPLMLATVIYLAKTLRDTRLLPNEYFPQSLNEADPVRRIINDLANIGNVFYMNPNEWREPMIRHTLSTERSSWNLNFISQLFIRLQLYSLGF